MSQKFDGEHVRSISLLKKKLEAEVDAFSRQTGCQDAVVVIHVYTKPNEGYEGTVTVTEVSVKVAD